MKFIYIVSPLTQFEIRDLLEIGILIYNRISITNIGLYLTIGTSIIIIIFALSLFTDNIISNRWSLGMESLYGTIKNIVISQIGYSKGQVFLPCMYTLFIFIFIHNIIGMIPYSFASTSHFLLTFSISFVVVLGSTISGFYKKGFKFFAILVPSGCPLGLLPLLVLIELISYIARHLSLGLRLAANITAGHMLLYILSGFTYNMMKSYVFPI
jgi:F-type H+-transporting ATPase subunit a